MSGSLSEVEGLVRLVLALALGAAIGFERETHDRPAGLRTFILVCVGSALIMIVSVVVRDLYPYSGVDPGRIAAQVVTGIGFLGAGTIMHEGPFVRGLTTAAGLWVVSAIGLAVGLGLYLLAAVTTVLSLLTLTVLAHIERSYIGAKGYGQVTVVTTDQPGQLGRIGSALGETGVDIKDIRLQPREMGLVEIELRVRAPSREALERAMQTLVGIEGVRSAEYVL